MGVAQEIGKELANVVKIAVSAIGTALTTTARVTWQYVARPLGASGINLLGYAIEKFLWGPPGLRPYAEDGLFPAGVSQEKRKAIIEDYGFDPYARIHPILDNILGAIFGAGLGVFQYLNFTTLAIKHFFLSIGYNVRATYNLILGKHGVLENERLDYQDDERPLYIRIIYGIVTAPIVAVISTVANAFDLAIIAQRNAWHSFAINIKRTFNLILGDVGTFGERRTVDDERHVVVRWAFGLLTAPAVVVVSGFTNALDCSIQLIYHGALSVGHNIKATHNLLGQYGVLGERGEYTDERESRLTKVGFGILTAPIVFPISLLTNLVDASCTAIQHTAQSTARNLRPTLHLLGEYGTFGERRAYEDNRGLAAKIVYGVISAPITVPMAILTNTADGVITVIHHTAQSVGHLTQRYHNILGEYGLYGPRLDNADERATATQWVYGIIASPIAIPAILIPNMIDFVGTFIIHTDQSTAHNLSPTLNLLGEYGSFGQRGEYQDDRGLPAKIAYGIASFPIVFPVALITNLADGAVTVLRHTGKSVKHQVHRNYHILGKHGLFGERAENTDQRNTVTQWVYGIVAAPIIIPSVMIPNTIDFVGTFIKHTGLSYYHNMRYSLAMVKALKDHEDNASVSQQDTRHAAVKWAFGVLTFPPVLVSSIICYAGVGGFRFIQHSMQSVKYNILASYNVMGEQGIFGKRSDYLDPRTTPIKVAYGIITSPIVATVVTLSNAADMVLTGGYHIGQSIYQNIRANFNLLGANGIFGKPFAYRDNRPLPIRILFGIPAMIVVIPTVTLTNTADLIITFGKHLGLSYIRNVRATYHLLSDHGILGKREPLDDSRHLAVKIIFGTLTAPAVFLTNIFPNLVDAGLTTIKHIGLSYHRNTKALVNLLGEHGVMGERAMFQDDRHLAVKIIFGTLTAPVVAISVTITNSVDGTLTTLWHAGASIGHNIRSTFNIILGKHGTFNERRALEDQRHLVLKIIFGTLTAPVVLMSSALTNLLDLSVTGIKHTALSFVRNTAPMVNLLGHHGVFGERESYHDERHRVVRGIFGVISAPLVLLSATVTNTADAVFTGVWHTTASLGRNTLATYNIVLGQHGILGDRIALEDDRHLALKIIFGTISAPAVFLISSVSNAFDLTVTGLKHTASALVNPHFWQTGGQVIGGALVAILAVPLFMLRKTLKALYYIGIKEWTDPLYSRTKLLKAFANLLTLGVAGMFFKFFGVSARFRSGYMNHHPEQDQQGSIIQGKNVMRELIYQAKSGQLEVAKPQRANVNGGDNGEAAAQPTNVDPAAKGRKVLRFLGLKHSSETILREWDDQYRLYLQGANNESEQFGSGVVEPIRNWANFFSSKQGQQAVTNTKMSFDKELDLINDLQALIKNKTAVVGG